MWPTHQASDKRIASGDRLSGLPLMPDMLEEQVLELLAEAQRLSNIGLLHDRRRTNCSNRAGFTRCAQLSTDPLVTLEGETPVLAEALTKNSDRLVALSERVAETLQAIGTLRRFVLDLVLISVMFLNAILYSTEPNQDVKNPHAEIDDHGDPEVLLDKLTAVEAEAANLRDQLKAILSEALSG